jgi:hypothetical protein
MNLCGGGSPKLSMILTIDFNELRIFVGEVGCSVGEV